MLHAIDDFFAFATAQSVQVEVLRADSFVFLLKERLRSHVDKSEAQVLFV